MESRMVRRLVLCWNPVDGRFLTFLIPVRAFALGASPGKLRAAREPFMGAAETL